MNVLQLVLARHANELLEEGKSRYLTIAERRFLAGGFQESQPEPAGRSDSNVISIEESSDDEAALSQSAGPRD